MDAPSDSAADKGISPSAGRAQPHLDIETRFSDLRPGTLDRIVWSTATTGFLSSRLRKAIRKKLGASRAGPFDIMAEGIRFRAYPTENRCDRVITGQRQLPERSERALLAPFVRKGSVFVDIGANVGTYTLWASRLVGPAGRVVALEPHPRTYAKLRFNILANEALNIVVLNVAAGNEEGTALLRFDGGGNIGGASLLASEGGASDVSVPITMRPLKTLIENAGLPRPDVIKVDIEGFEDQALLPYYEMAEPTLWPVTVMVETALKERWKTDCVSFLKERGYKEKAATKENVILQRGG
ncbi:MAG TPA: FkbM family methyltransferase [Rhizobiaceae bacterium]|nr:FkbM family methyltransferase [Rhizobiaceae bacterium]